MSDDIHSATDKLAHDMMLHAIEYFEQGNNADVLHEIRVRINSALERVERRQRPT